MKGVIKIVRGEYISYNYLNFNNIVNGFSDMVIFVTDNLYDELKQLEVDTQFVLKCVKQILKYIQSHNILKRYPIKIEIDKDEIDGMIHKFVNVKLLFLHDRGVDFETFKNEFDKLLYSLYLLKLVNLDVMISYEYNSQQQ